MGRLETPPTRPLRPSNRTPEKVLPSRGSPAPGKPARPEELLRQENALLGRALEELQARHDELVQSLGSQPPPKTGPSEEERALAVQLERANAKVAELELEVSELREVARADTARTSSKSCADVLEGLTAERCTYWKQRCLEAGLKLVELEQLCAAQRTQNTAQAALCAEAANEHAPWHAQSGVPRHIFDELTYLRQQYEAVSAEAASAHERLAVVEEMRVEDLRALAKLESLVFAAGAHDAGRGVSTSTPTSLGRSAPSERPEAPARREVLGALSGRARRGSDDRLEPRLDPVPEEQLGLNAPRRHASPPRPAAQSSLT